MLMKILLKIWPALTPILIYAIYQLFLKKLLNKIYKSKNNFNQSNSTKIIDAEIEEVVGQKNTETKNSTNIFSLRNKNFIIILYLSLILAIVAVLSFAF